VIEGSELFIRPIRPIRLIRLIRPIDLMVRWLRGAGEMNFAPTMMVESHPGGIPSGLD
jgi:hypothetical protein